MGGFTRTLGGRLSVLCEDPWGAFGMFIDGSDGDKFNVETRMHAMMSR